MTILRCAAAIGLFVASIGLAWAQPRYVEIPAHPLAAPPAQGSGPAQKPTAASSITGGPTTELRMVQSASGQWQMRCEQLDAEGPSSYSQWLERVTRHREVTR